MKFPKLYDEKLMEFIGIMLGDGSIGIYKSRVQNKIKTQYKVQVTLDSREKQYFQYIQNLIKELFEVEPRLTFRKNENTIDIRMFRIDIFNFLVDNVGLKLSPKFGKMKIPDRYINKKSELNIIRGLFDTDGHISITKNNGILYPRLELKISKSPLQGQVIEILTRNKFNIKMSILNKKLIRVRLNGRNELDKWVNKIGTSNKRHLEKIKQIE